MPPRPPASRDSILSQPPLASVTCFATAAKCVDNLLLYPKSLLNCVVYLRQSLCSNTTVQHNSRVQHTNGVDGIL